MNNKIKRKLYIFEMIKWVVILGLVITSVVGNYLYRYYNVLTRVIIVFIVIAIAIYIMSTTKLGKIIFTFGNESRAELRKVVWPSCREGLNTTFVVIGVTIVMSLLLWGLDTVLVHLISFGLKL